MALEFRFYKGKLSDHFFGRCISDGVAKVYSLETLIKGTPPMKNGRPSLYGVGDTLFEISRAKAEAELKERATESKQSGRADHLIKRLIESKTGHKWKAIPLKDLPDFAANMKKGQSADWAGWRCKVIAKFVEWAKEQGLKTILHIRTETAEKYLKTVADGSKSPETMKHIKGIFVGVFDKALPQGVENPFRGVTIEPDADGSSDMEHRTPLNHDEENLLLETARKTDPFTYQLIVAALSTGLRRGDVCRLKWEDVKFRTKTLTVKTRKTKEEVELPIMPTFLEVLETQLATKKEKAVYVFPEAERMIEDNPDGVTYRIKRAFALAFQDDIEDAPEGTKEPQERVALADVLPKVLKAVQAAEMPDSRREKMMDLLNLSAIGKKYREIQDVRKISRNVISDLLYEAQSISGFNFMPDHNGGGKSLRKAIKNTTRKTREVGTRSASKYDFHSLRTTFCTRALNASFSIEKLKAITGHKTVETIQKHYYKPKGTDHAAELLAVMPSGLLGSSQKPLPAASDDRLAEIARALGELSETERKQLQKIINTGRV